MNDKRDMQHDQHDESDEPDAGPAPYDDESRELDDDREDWPTPFGDTGRGALVAAGLVGVVTTLVLVLLWSVLTRGGDTPRQAAERPDPTSSASIGEGATSEPPARATGATRLSRCGRSQDALQEPLEATRPTVDQWAVHVGAMNKLVVGEITLQQATAFWRSTRVGAQRRVKDFRDAVETLRQQGVDCPSPELLAPGARTLPGCVREVQADMSALRAAQVSIDTWDQHIQHMDMLLRGQMTPEEATRMWLASWQRGVRDLDAYKTAAREAQREDGCGQAGSAE